jgi:hypothetical protein
LSLSNRGCFGIYGNNTQQAYALAGKDSAMGVYPIKITINMDNMDLKF